MEKTESKAKGLKFYGGWWGVCSGFIVMIAGILALTISGQAMPMAFWVPTLAGMGVMLLLAKDKKQCADAMIEGMSQELVLTIVMALFLGGIFAKLMTAAGLVDGLIWLSLKIGLKGAAFCVITFFAGCLLSTATGTALGTLIALTPILYPVGVAMGASPVCMAGALVSASYFGDNIAPVSDTTIASAVTQGSTLSKAVRARLKYAFVAAAIAVVLFIIFGGGGVQTATEAANYNPMGLVMLIVPAILIVMMFRDANLLVAIFTSVTIGIIIGLVTKLITWSSILFVDMDAFAVSGIIADGITGMMDSAVFALLVMSIVHIIQETGFLDMLIEKMAGLTKTDTSAEFTIGIISVILSFMTLANTIAIIIEGPVAKRVLVEDHKIGPERSAAILDAFSAAGMGLCPYAFAPLLAVVFAAGTGATMDFTAVQVSLFSFYNSALLVVMIVATLTGWGRTKYKDDPQVTVPFKKLAELDEK